MIATGLVFLLGALVATLLALLFVPLLWRNAQRLARRDYAATMPATMGEIRAEVDRVRAEAAMNVRRHEMQTAKARERLALAKAEIGRLTAANAKLTFSADQNVAEANVLRGQIAGLENALRGLEDDRLRLVGENEELKELLAEVESEIQAMDERARSAPGVRATAAAPDEGKAPPADDPDAVRIAAATTALLALAREHRRARRPDEGAAEAASSPPTAVDAPPPAPAKTTAEGRVVDELRALAAAPRPTDPAARQRQNAQVRERIADVAARIIQLTMHKEGPDSQTRELLEARPLSDRAEGAEATPDLAERVRRLSQGSRRSREAPEPETETETKTAAESPALASPPSVSATGDPAPVSAPRGKRRRGASRSRPPSPR